MVKRENKKQGYFKVLKEAIKESFKFKNGLKVFLLNLAFFVLSLIMLSAFGLFIISKLASVTLGADLTSLFSSLQDSSKLLTFFQPILVPVLIALFFLALFNFFVKYFFSGLTWKIFLEKEFTFKFYFKFLLFNLCFSVISSIIFYLLQFFTKIPQVGNIVYLILFVVFMFLFLHFYFIMSYKLAEKDKLKVAISEGFSEGIPIHLFLLPYLYVILISAVFIGVFGGLFLSVFGKSALASYAGVVSAIESFNFDFNLISGFLKSLIPIACCLVVIFTLLLAYIKKFYVEFVRRV